jgi:hypothetical protein
MKQKDFTLFAGILLNTYKLKYPQYHCKKNYCCGICDRFYSCLFDLLEKISQHAKAQLKEKL